jgi:DNA repair protein RadC
VVVHNHPSGDPTPSNADIEATRKVAEALKAIGVALHDHLIVGRTGHASLKSAGLMEP